MSIGGRNLNTSGDKTVAHSGLSEKEARLKYEKHGPNILTGKKKISAFYILLEQFSDYMVLILLASTAISAFMGELTEAVTIIAIVAVNAVMGFIQEFRTEKTMEALKNLAAPMAKVVRDGGQYSIPAEQLVPGDLIILEAGDRVGADSVLVESNSLQVDESLLTGESVPVEKDSDSSGSRSLHSRSLHSNSKKNTVFMGTVVTGGRGKGIVFSTGMATEMGKIADMIQNIENDETPLQKKLNHLGKLIAAGCLCICAVVTAAGILRGEAPFTMLLAGISLAVAAVPEGLPAIVTIALAMGVQRMLKRNALIRKLPAVETLGCATVICSDKTGTLTENKMTVRSVFAGGHMIAVKDSGTKGGGSFLLKGRQIKPLHINAAKLAIEAGAVCNNAELFLEGQIRRLSGDPTECALIMLAEKSGLSKETLDKTYFRIFELPFDSDRKCMSVVCDVQNGETFVFTKGAPDMVVEKCSKIFGPSGVVELTVAIREQILKVNDSMASDALRVIAMAYKKLDSRLYKNVNLEKDLIFAGLAGIIDPPRKEAVDAVQKCILAGIKPVMITGDHKNTAVAVAKELNIFGRGDKVLTGAEIEETDIDKLAKTVDDVSVFARVSPRHKLMIVKAFKKKGHIVAMTGDGVNDAPAVKEADIGVAMGLAGTDVTKEASSMILTDDNFASIVAAVEEGRVIYNNIRKFIRYMLACNLGEVLTMFIGMLLGFPLPLLPIQVLWVNLVTDGLPAIALGLDPPERDIMMRPPRGVKENVFSQGLLFLIIFRGVLIGFSTLAVFASTLYFTSSIETARTCAFVTLVLTQLVHVFECKSERKNIFEIPVLNNIWLVLSVICSFIMIIGVIYVPLFQNIFKTVPIEWSDWILVVGFSALGPVVSSMIGKRKGKTRYR